MSAMQPNFLRSNSMSPKGEFMSIIIQWKIHGFAHRALSFVLVYFRFYSFTKFTIQLNDPEYGTY